MGNVLSEEKKQQVIALGKLGWPLRRIEQVTGVRRETASAAVQRASGATRSATCPRKARSSARRASTRTFLLRAMRYVPEGNKPN